MRRFASAAGLLGSLLALASFAVFLYKRSTDEFTPLYSGWQVDLVAGGIAAGLVVAVAVSICVLRRLSGARAELRTHRRLPVLLAVLPGLVFGGGVFAAATKAVTWASDHTAQADATRTLLVSYRLTPPKMPSLGPLAPTALAARLLTSANLGAGWYDATNNNPASLQVSPDATSQGQTAGVRGVFDQQHRTGTAATWLIDTSLFEDLRVFGRDADAASYLDSWTQQHQADSLTQRAIDGITVTQGSSRSAQLASFAIGRNVFTLDAISRLVGTPQQFDRLVQAAVRQAKPVA